MEDQKNEYPGHTAEGLKKAKDLFAVIDDSITWMPINVFVKVREIILDHPKL